MIDSLAYLGFNSPNAQDWTDFGPNVLGLQLTDPGPDGALRLRMDDAAWRLAIAPGDTDDLAYIGWAVADPDALSAAIEALTAAGVDVHTDDALAADRSVDGLAWFTDPFGFRHELVWGQHRAGTAFEPGRPISGFVTGDQGLGHVVLIVPDLDAATAFFVDTLGFRHSDDIDMGFTVRFMHCNPRHHTLAMTSIPGMVGVHHVMIEVADVDDVGRAYDIVQQRGIPLPMSYGRHTNDEMTSFYVRTPSGFEIEYGSGGRVIATTQPWPVGHYDAMSFWGHHPPDEVIFPGILRPAEVSA